MERRRLQPAARRVVRAGDGLVQPDPTGSAAARPPSGEEAGPFFGGDFQFDPWAKAQGWLTAFDAATGMQRWRHQSSKPMIGAIAVTGGDVVLASEITRRLPRLRRPGWQDPLQAQRQRSGRGGLVSYAVGGKQYVAVVSGFVGGYYNQMAPEIGGGNPTITVFALKP